MNLQTQYRVSQKSVPPNPKRDVFFTKTYSQGMKVIALGKSNRPRAPRPVDMINCIRIYSRKESETNTSQLASSL